MSVVIEKGIPIPKNQAGRPAKWSKLAREMEFNDSVLLKSKIEVSAMRRAIYNTGYKAIVRTVAPNEYRLWKGGKNE